MEEAFLHYLWRFQLWNTPLQTCDGERIEVVASGFHNNDGGPDFSDARIRIGNTLWAGHVEIHTKSSDWNTHHHQHDPAYNTVILHVVFNPDSCVKRAMGTEVPTCSVNGKFSPNLYETYLNWLGNKGFVACEKQLSKLSNPKRILFLERLNIERLEEKTAEILRDLSYNVNSWEETFYQHLLRSFGLRINADAFLQIAKCTPLKFLQKHTNSRFQLEAMLFGQAQLLYATFKDDYPRALQEEYAFFQQKFKLLPITAGLMKFLRLRPCSFPTLRLAFFASLIQQKTQIFQEILQIQNLEDGFRLFDVSTSEYWQTHYVFDKLSIEKNKELGESSRQLILINTLIPFLFAFGKSRDKPDLCERALHFLQKLPAENNGFTRLWNTCGMPAHNASDSQALLVLKKKYCDSKQCLHCAIGIELLKQS